MTAAPAYRLGLPAWAFPGWQGRYFDARELALVGYARVFNAVEGNTTFYRIPDDRTVAQWRDALRGEDFELCFKLPRSVTHERHPRRDELTAFLTAIAPLRAQLGPLLLQFPETAGPDALGRFEPLLGRVCERHRVVLEVRHPDFFREPELLAPLLDRYDLGRVVLDTRALYRGDRSHPEVLAAQHTKPDLPVLPQARHGMLFVRLVLHPDLQSNVPFLAEWARRAADCIASGERTWVMIHCPNNLHCPELARAFHERLRAHLPELPALPPWPVPQQQTLL